MRSASFGVTLAVAGLLVGCGRAAVTQNGAFGVGDACDQVVLDAIGRHSELRWSQRRAELGRGEYIDTARGFAPGENVHPSRQWTRYHGSSSDSSGLADVLTGVVWESDPATGGRRPRTDFMSLDCGRHD